MKKVKLITEDEHNGKEAISRTPLRNKYFFAGQWHEVKLKISTFDDDPLCLHYPFWKPEILRDAQIIEVTEAIFAEMPDTFDIRAFTSHVACEMADQVKYPREATIDRQLRQLRQYGKLNYKCIDEQRGIYQKLPVISKTCAEQVKIEFQPDMKKRFVEFLKKEGAYEKYTNNIKSMSPFKEQSDSKYNMVTNLFTWGASPEGCDYWSKLNAKWQEVCR